jgi:hypothetical protein
LCPTALNTTIEELSHTIAGLEELLCFILNSLLLLLLLWRFWGQGESCFGFFVAFGVFETGNYIAPIGLKLVVFLF